MVGVDDLAVLEGRARAATSSSPVETTVTRGRGSHEHLGARWPRRRAPGGPGPSRVPGAEDHVTGADVLAPAAQVAARRAAPGAGRPRSAPPSVSSTGTTASAPSGSGAPVMIRMALAGRQHVPPGVAGGDVAADRQDDRAARGVAPASSAARTAYPSIAELSKPGRSTAATTSCGEDEARAPPRPGTRTGGSGATSASTAARCSSSVRITRRPRGARRRGWCARRRSPGRRRCTRRPAPNVASASTRRLEQSRIGRHALREALLEAVDELVRRRRGRRTAPRGRSSTRRGSRRSAGRGRSGCRSSSLVVLTGRNRLRSTASARDPSNTSTAAPIADSIWMTGRAVGPGRVDGLAVDDDRQAEDRRRARPAARRGRRGRPRGCSRGTRGAGRCPGRSGPRPRRPSRCRAGRAARRLLRTARWPPLRSLRVRAQTSVT